MWQLAIPADFVSSHKSVTVTAALLVWFDFPASSCYGLWNKAQKLPKISPHHDVGFASKILEKSKNMNASPYKVSVVMIPYP